MKERDEQRKAFATQYLGNWRVQNIKLNPMAVHLWRQHYAEVYFLKKTCKTLRDKYAMPDSQAQVIIDEHAYTLRKRVLTYASMLKIAHPELLDAQKFVEGGVRLKEGVCCEYMQDFDLRAIEAAFSNQDVPEHIDFVPLPRAGVDELSDALAKAEIITREHIAQQVGVPLYMQEGGELSGTARSD